MIIAAIFGAYIITAVITGSSLFHHARERFKHLTPWLAPAPNHPHFIDCRLCVGFWVSLLVTTAICNPWPDAFIVYGASYFLATQER